MELDVLRGAAILLVLGHHLPGVIRVQPAIDALFDFVHRVGWAGVDLFFVLSGFLIGGLLFAEYDRRGSLDLTRFWIRRGCKIWPAYLVCLIAHLLFFAWYFPGADGVGYAENFCRLLGRFWPNFLHVQNYFRIDSPPRLTWLWSLAVEEHFYLILPPALAWLISRSNRNGLRRPAGVLQMFCVVAIACLCGRTFALWASHGMDRDGVSLRFPTQYCADALFAGVALAFLVNYHKEFLTRIRRVRFLLLFVFPAVLAIPAFSTEDQPFFFYPFGNVLLYVGAASLVLFAHLTGLNDGRPVAQGVGAWARRRIAITVAWIGGYSYSIYIWHGYFAEFATWKLEHALGLPWQPTGVHGLPHVVLYFSVCIVLGVVTTQLIEAPALRLRDRLFPSLAR